MSDPAARVTVAELASALIASFEGCKLQAYQDTGGVWSIGFGHTGADVHQGLVITQAQADALFEQDCARLLILVSGRPLIEAAALLSFGYNCGSGNLAAVLAGHDSIGNPRHTTDKHGTVQAGLVHRRNVEELLIAASQQMMLDSAKYPAKVTA